MRQGSGTAEGIARQTKAWHIINYCHRTVTSFLAFKLSLAFKTKLLISPIILFTSNAERPTLGAERRPAQAGGF
jgi:hypothetical protein